MTKRTKVLAITGASLAGLLLLTVVISISVIRTQWFRDYVRNKIISITEESTGGKVTIGSFDFDWTALHVVIKNFVLHGTEPASEPPLFKAQEVDLQLKLFAGLKKAVDLEYLGVRQPAVNVMVFPDGKTNIPSPRVPSKPSEKSGLETVVNLAIHKFEIVNGYAQYQQQKTAFSAKGENLRAQLFYDTVSPQYRGELNIDPLLLSSAGQEPLRASIHLPVVLLKDEVDLRGARISTVNSVINLTGALQNMKSPQISGNLDAHIALSDIQQASHFSLDTSWKGAPSALDASAAIHMDDQTIRISTAQLTFGKTKLTASGPLKSATSEGSLKVNLHIALDEVGKLLRLSAQPSGNVDVAGDARFSSSSDYLFTGNIDARKISVREGKTAINGLNLSSPLQADPRKIALNGFRFAGLGGEITGNAQLEQGERLQLESRVSGFSIPRLTASFTGQQVNYDGTLSGSVTVQGNLKSAGTTGFAAQAHLGITPGGHGVPVSGAINADYQGRNNAVVLGKSYLGLPHSRLDISGVLGRQVDAHLVSRNLNDFLPMLALGSGKPATSMPVTLSGGTADITSSLTGPLSSPNLAGRVSLIRFTTQQRYFDRFSVDVAASPSAAAVHGGELVSRSAHAQFDGSIGLTKWSTTPHSPIALQANIPSADLADILALAGETPGSSHGAVTASARVQGTLGNPQGSAHVTVANGVLNDEPFDQIAIEASFADQIARVQRASIIAGPSRVDLNATYTHPRDSFVTGHLEAHVASNQLAIAQFKIIQQKHPGLKGILQFSADTTADIQNVAGQSEIAIRTITADLNARDLADAKQNLGNLTASARTQGTSTDFQLQSDFAGSTIHIAGQTQLTQDYPTTADLSIHNLEVEKVLTLADQTGIPVKGNFNADGRLQGTIANPTANLNLSLRQAVVYGDAINRLQATLIYSGQEINVPALAIDAPAGTLKMSAAFTHPLHDFHNGNIQFHFTTDGVQLAKVHNVQKSEPGLAGLLRGTIDAAARLSPTAHGQILLTKLDSDFSASSLQMNKQQLGSLKLASNTNGSSLSFRLDSDLAKSSIHGSGQAQLSGDYPIQAQLDFDNLLYSNLSPLLAAATSSTRSDFDGLVAGKLTVKGPALQADKLEAILQLNQVQLTTIARGTTDNKRVTALQNQGPIVVHLSQSSVNMQSVHLTGRDTDINVGGNMALNNGGQLNLKIDASTNLSLLQDFDRDIYSDGQIVLQANVRGALSQPLVNGKLELKNASLNLASSPNGISNANGVIALNGNRATITQLTAESGGGKITLRGFATFGSSALRYTLRANAAHVRSRYQGASVIASANANLTGTSEHSVLSGTVTLEKIAYNSQSDFGSMLSTTATPTETPSVPTGFLAGMHLDINVRTAPGARFQTSLAERLQADADLNIRGTLASPGIVGAITVSEGTLVFFGNEYSVNRGQISFYDPTRIAPVLDVDLETTVKGVDVILGVSGPIQNMKLNYRSDPPLRFDEIVALLATGKAPTSDPTVAAHQPTQPTQSVAQMGESALVSQAVAAPIANRIQRVFGVSQLKIDPTFNSGSSLPQARVTLQQQISGSITFTYTQDLTESNSQIIKVEWAFTPRFSAVATRDENGIFGIDFFVKKQFR